jgi:hypothetical protein
LLRNEHISQHFPIHILFLFYFKQLLCILTSIFPPPQIKALNPCNRSHPDLLSAVLMFIHNNPSPHPPPQLLVSSLVPKRTPVPRLTSSAKFNLVHSSPPSTTIPSPRLLTQPYTLPPQHHLFYRNHSPISQAKMMMPKARMRAEHPPQRARRIRGREMG